MSGTPPEGGAVFALDATLERFMGNRPLLVQAVAAFLAQAPALMVKLASCAVAADAAGVCNPAHLLKGSAATVGAEHVAAIAGAIEQSALQGDADAAGARMLELQAALQLFREEAAQALPATR